MLDCSSNLISVNPKSVLVKASDWESIDADISVVAKEGDYRSVSAFDINNILKYGLEISQASSYYKTYLSAKQ